PSDVLKPNAWEGTCGIEISKEGIIEVVTGTGAWWGCALEIPGKGENLSNFKDGYLNFEIKGKTKSSFKIGFQTGRFAEGTQINNFVTFGPKESYTVSNDWKPFSIPMSSLYKEADLTNVTAIIYFTGDTNFDGKPISVKNIYYSHKK
ncbi:MAG: exo-beta-1,3-glucanase, partial [Flavobacteriaceae bacterium]|nr:exo-beta-1,3-glucanase [Flavobacteriaceae bacterium]